MGWKNLAALALESVNLGFTLYEIMVILCISLF